MTLEINNIILGIVISAITSLIVQVFVSFIQQTKLQKTDIEMRLWVLKAEAAKSGANRTVIPGDPQLLL